jgi:xanthine/uracil permease
MLVGESRGLHIAAATLTLVAMVGLAVWGRGLVRLLSTLLGLLLGCVVAFALGFVVPQALQAIREAPFFGVPRLSHWPVDSRAFWRRYTPTKCASGLTTNAVIFSWFSNSRPVERHPS